MKKEKYVGLCDKMEEVTRALLDEANPEIPNMIVARQWPFAGELFKRMETDEKQFVVDLVTTNLMGLVVENHVEILINAVATCLAEAQTETEIPNEYIVDNKEE